jgi:hypothetical protein
MDNQATKTIMMVRPKHFGFDIESAVSNPFQKEAGADDKANIQELALAEFDNAVDILRSAGLSVIVIEDSDKPIKPNAIFPNNWVSFHEKFAIIYPMMATNRRAERREEVFLELSNHHFDFEQIIDLSSSELDNKYLESTGSVIFDYPNKLAYASKSERTDPEILDVICDKVGFDAVVFDAFDKGGLSIYHTNVLMCLAMEYCVICLESIPHEQRNTLIDRLENTGHEVFPISLDQMYAFAGNMFEVENDEGESVLVMSSSAFNSLEESQVKKLEQYSKLIQVPIPTIEKYGGGSIRCMMCRVN